MTGQKEPVSSSRMARKTYLRPSNGPLPLLECRRSFASTASSLDLLPSLNSKRQKKTVAYGVNFGEGSDRSLHGVASPAQSTASPNGMI